MNPTYCGDCGDPFHYDDCGGYNPPCNCGRCYGLCRLCCESIEREDEDDYEYCDDYDEESGSFCCLPHGHSGMHQSQRCNGTCDTCGCVDWGESTTPADRRALEGEGNG